MKRKSCDEERRPDKKKWKTYTKAEKKAYKASKQSGTGKKAQGAGKTSEWDQMHKGIPKNLLADRRKNGGCTCCGLMTYQWRNCQKEAQVKVIRRAPWTPGKGKDRNANQQKLGRPQTSMFRIVNPEVRQVRTVQRPIMVWDDLSDREGTTIRKN